jgi:hypothetical protein
MNDKLFVMGWIDPYTTQFEKVDYTAERKAALVTRIRKRHYWFTHFDHEFMNATPIYSDNKYCILTKKELDEAFAEAYKDMDIEGRKLPEDEEETVMHNGIRYEKKKYIKNEE